MFRVCKLKNKITKKDVERSNTNNNLLLYITFNMRCIKKRKILFMQVRLQLAAKTTSYYFVIK